MDKRLIHQPVGVARDDVLLGFLAGKQHLAAFRPDLRNHPTADDLQAHRPGSHTVGPRLSALQRTGVRNHAHRPGLKAHRRGVHVGNVQVRHVRQQHRVGRRVYVLGLAGKETHQINAVRVLLDEHTAGAFLHSPPRPARQAPNSHRYD